MGENDYQTGYRGGQYHHGMDRAEYDRGQGQKDLENTLSGGGRTSSSGGGSLLGLVFIAPLMFMTYPAGGISALCILGGVSRLLDVFHVPPFTISLICVAVAFPTLFAAIWLEKKASMNIIYRVFRLIWRTVVCGMAIFAGSLISSLGIAKQRINLDLILQNLDQSGGALLWTALLMTGLFWFLRKADRAYFPTTGVVEQNSDANVKATTVIKPNGAPKRILMSVIWFIPVALGTHLIIRLLVDAYFGSTQSDPDTEILRKAFYQKNLIFIYIADVMVWLLVSIKGILPGTGK